MGSERKMEEVLSGERNLQEDLAREVEEIYRKFQAILEDGYPGVVYLPIYYRATPPYIFLFPWGIRALTHSLDIENGRDKAAIFLERGYRHTRDARYQLTYRFEKNLDFTLPLEGGELIKHLDSRDEWLEEIYSFRKKLGIFKLVPLVSLEDINAGEQREEVKRIPLRIKMLVDDLPLPAYAHAGDAGLDLRSAEDKVIEPGSFSLISSGFAMALPKGYAAFIQPRSGLAAKHGISIVNTPGLVDCHYRGEVKIILINHGKEPFQVKKGDRIAQMVIQKVENARVEVVEELDPTSRGEGGFGSTGL